MSAPTIGRRTGPAASCEVLYFMARGLNAEPVPTPHQVRGRLSANRALLDHVVQQSEKARPLDRARKLALLLGRDRGDAARQDLAALRNVPLQQLHVLV